MSEFLNSILPVQEYRYGEFKIFSIFDFMGKMMVAKMVEKKLNKDLLDSDISVTDILKNDIIRGMEFYYNGRNSAITCKENACFIVVKNTQFGTLAKKMVSIINKKSKNTLPKMSQFYQEGININLLQKKYGSTATPEYDGQLLLGRVWVDHLKALGMPSENAQSTVELAVSEIVNILNSNRVKP